MSKYQKYGNTIRVIPNSDEIYSDLPVGLYSVHLSPLSGFFLNKMTDWKDQGKIYGRTNDHVKKIIKTFSNRTTNTGVLLSGEKGSGKTLMARLIANDCASLNMPTIIVNECFTDRVNEFCSFITSIKTPSVVMFDEFEKLYANDEDQESILSLFDGVYESKKLFILTVNRIWHLNDLLINRPGRLYYHFKFDHLEKDFALEYARDKLNNQDFLSDIEKVIDVIPKINFDMLKHIIEESNIHEESPTSVIKLMNITLEGDKYYQLNISKNDKSCELFLEINLHSRRNRVYVDFIEDYVHFSMSDLKSVKDGLMIFETSDGYKIVLKEVVQKPLNALDFVF